jgi:hypothetical protein
MDTMELKGFYAQIMKAPRLTGDHVHSLPPGSPTDIYPVDLFNEPLPHWIKGQGNYVVPVQPDWGLWFNWTRNDTLNTSVMPTVKGMNPVTGQKTEGYGLEKYENKCPVHNIDFKEGRFCEECTYKWPPQNYVAAPNRLWWDGFRTSDGKVRQFFFTEDLAKSIPENVIGKQNTVPAFGFAFYKTKQTRVNPLGNSRGWMIGDMSGVSITNSTLSGAIGCKGPLGNTGSIGLQGPQGISGLGISGTLTGYTPPGAYTSNSLNVQLDSLVHQYLGKAHTISEPDIAEACDYVIVPQGGIGPCSQSTPTNGVNATIAALAKEFTSIKISDFEQHQESIQLQPDSGSRGSQKISKEIKTSASIGNAEVGIGAGAQIHQDLLVDPLKLEDWQEEPAAVMRLYFIFMDQFNILKDKGFKDLTGNKEGFLSNMPVG